MVNEIEEELIRRCQRGDKGAFAELVRKYQRFVFSLLFRMLPDKDSVEDLAQEVWVKVYNSIGKVKTYSSFKSWLNRIAITTYYSKKRKESDRNEVSLSEMFSDDDSGEQREREIEDPSPIPEEILLSEEWKIFVDKTLRAMPEQSRLLIVMKDNQSLSYEEIGDILGITIGTVKSRLSRAREMMIKELSLYFKEPKRL
ncbi:MAG: sigma-70 family RNA polymerase sigma factor [Cyanobacteriota bacterium]